MSIATAIQNAQTKVAAAYTACNNKGATMPASGSQTLTNLASTINTITTSIPVNQQIQTWWVGDRTTISSVSNENITSSDISEIGPSGTTRAMVYVTLTGDDWTGTLSVTSGSTLKYCLQLRNSLPQQGQSIPNTIWDGGWKTGGQTSSVDVFTSTSSDIKYLVMLVTYNSNGTGVPTLQEIKDNATFEIADKKISTYYRQSETVGSNYTLPQWKYSSDNNLIAVMIPEDTKPVNNCWAFNSCRRLQYINLENISNVSAGGAFVSGSALCVPVNMPKATGEFSLQFKSTKIPSIISLGSITAINNEIFGWCTKLTTVTLPSTIRELRWRCFEGCTNLTSINLPEGLLTIGGRVFYYDTKLSTTLPTSITTIDASAFQGCSSLTGSINLPNLTGTLKGQAFQESGITGVTSLGSITKIEGGSSAVGAFCHCHSLASVILPSTLTQIEAGVFAYDSALTTINLPTSLTYIGGQVFQGCTSLSFSDINLPNLETLGGCAFCGPAVYKVSNLGSITTLEDGGAGGSTFVWSLSNWNGSLEEVWLPATLTKIGSYTFYHHPNLQILACLATTPPTLGTNALTGSTSNLKIYVPYSSDHSILAAYQTATNWSSYASLMYELTSNGEIPT